MKSSIDRISEIKKSDTPSRLVKGAENLGVAWRAGQRCLSGFSRICPCANPTDFCQIKLKWIQIAEEYHGGQPFGLSGYEPYYVIEAMTASQLRATRLDVIVELPSTIGDGARIRIGPGGSNWKTLLDLAALQDDDATLAVAVDAVVKLQKADRR